jgi:integrase
MTPYKFGLKDIENDETVKRMLSRRTLAAQTRMNYVKGIRFFCEYFNAEPSKLIERFKALKQDQIVEEFAEFFAWAKDKVAPKSAWGWLPGIRAWLVENGVREVDRVGREIAREFKRKFGPAKPLLRRDVVTKEEIIRVLKIAPKRERAIIETMASSGLRLSAALNLQLKHFRDDIWDVEKPCYAIEIPETLSKEGIPYITFISSEAAESIRDLLLDRSSKGEKLGPETYIFVTKKGSRLSAKRFENIWRELCSKAGLDMKPALMPGLHPVGKKGGGVRLVKGFVRYNTRLHSLRKFFKTACSVNGVDRMASEAFMGHSLSQFGIEGVYDFAISRFSWLRDEYLKVLPALTFLKPLPVLKVENHEARKRVEQLEAQLTELRSLVGDMSKELKKLQRATAMVQQAQKWLGTEEEE